MMMINSKFVMLFFPIRLASQWHRVPFSFLSVFFFGFFIVTGQMLWSYIKAHVKSDITLKQQTKWENGAGFGLSHVCPSQREKQTNYVFYGLVTRKRIFAHIHTHTPNSKTKQTKMFKINSEKFN